LAGQHIKALWSHSMKKVDFDIALFQCVQNDDLSAFETLFKTYYKKLCHFAFSFVRNEQDAEEIVSDLFFRIWRNRAALKIEISFSAYVYKACQNACLAKLKQRHPLFEDIEDLVEEDSIYVSEENDIHETLQDSLPYYEQALNALPPRCKLIFTLNRLEGMKYQEIADHLQISVKTVEHQLVKALRFIRFSVSKYKVQARNKTVTIT